MFNDQNNLIRFDLSEFSEKHTVAKLIGSPAGYVGYDDGGVLTEAVRRQPYSVLLFDEVEKAHSDFSDILLQVLDDGRLTDNKGRVIDFRNTIIFMTTNSQDVFHDFKDEVLGRLDGILEYEALGKDILSGLILKQVELLNSRLEDREIKIKLGQDLENILILRGYDERFGARPLKLVFEKLVLRPLSKLIVNGKVDSGTILADWDGHKVNFS